MVAACACTVPRLEAWVPELEMAWVAWDEHHGSHLLASQPCLEASPFRVTVMSPVPGCWQRWTDSETKLPPSPTFPAAPAADVDGHHDSTAGKGEHQAKVPAEQRMVEAACMVGPVTAEQTVTARSEPKRMMRLPSPCHRTHWWELAGLETAP